MREEILYEKLSLENANKYIVNHEGEMFDEKELNYFSKKNQKANSVKITINAIGSKIAELNIIKFIDDYYIIINNTRCYTNYNNIKVCFLADTFEGVKQFIIDIRKYYYKQMEETIKEMKIIKCHHILIQFNINKLP